MDDAIEKAVERVIRSMHDNLGEPITIDDMARTAMFSKFHFTRIFQRTTGLSPGRFLSALRLQEAKRLLLSTAMTVADISHVVGYNSVGTFSSRFRYSVGVSPTEYRRYRGRLSALPTLPTSEAGVGPALRGHVRHPQACRPGRVVIGLFSDRIAQGLPARHATLPGAGPFVLPNVPAGTWHLLACSTEAGREGREEYVATSDPVEVAPGRPVRTIDLRLRHRKLFDPPVLLAQLDEPMLAIRTWVRGATERAVAPGA